MMLLLAFLLIALVVMLVTGMIDLRTFIAAVLFVAIAFSAVWAAWAFSALGPTSAVYTAFSAFAGLEWTGCLLLATGVAYLIAPTEVGEVISDTVVFAGEVLGDVASAAAGAVGSLVSGLLNSPGGILVLGLGLWWLLRDKSESAVTTNELTQDKIYV
jgi:hypothetical protein